MIITVDKKYCQEKMQILKHLRITVNFSRVVLSFPSLIVEVPPFLITIIQDNSHFVQSIVSFEVFNQMSLFIQICLIGAQIISIYYQNTSLGMERYRRYGLTITKVAFLLLAICVGFTTFIIVEAFAYKSDRSSLDSLYSKNISDTSCLQLCPQTPVEQLDNCCNPTSTSCQPKSTCYYQKISEYQSIINQQSDYINYFSIPAVFFFVSFLIAIIYFFLLRKKSKSQQERLAYQEQLLAIQDQQELQFDDEEEQLENYDAFLQYMLENGYLYQIPTNQKKGDSKITDSFGTNDDTGCPICMMEYRQEKVLKLRCGHKFHSVCIRDWNQSKSSCPICRGDIYQ